MPTTTHLPYALYHHATPVLPRPNFTFRRLPQKLFFIGFNKTATSALHLLMLCSGVRAIHSSGNGKLFGRTPAERAAIPHATRHMADNIAADHDPLAGLEPFDCFMDLTIGPVDLCLDFDILHAAYPDAIFVLNTRDRDAWVTSRIKHGKSVKAAAAHFDIPREDVPALWAQQFDDHHAKVRTHFAASQTNNFLEWDISTPVSLLTGFLKTAGITADPAHFFRIRETDADYYPKPLLIRAQPQDIAILPAQS